eukprot:4423289-Prymnesium_polylepis.1
MGRWRDVVASRPSLILSFPRHAGGVIQRLRADEARGESYTPAAGGDGAVYQPMMEGSYFLSGGGNARRAR